MAIIVIDIGGTGARCAAAAMYALTSGLAESTNFSRRFGRKIQFLHIDKDEQNGTGKESEKEITNYGNMQNHMSRVTERMLARYEVEWGFWKMNTLRGAAGDADNNLREVFPAEGELLDLLFAEEDQNRRLDCGFEQRPALGAVYFARIQNELEAKIAAYMKNTTDDVAVFIFASAFGGCGASMFMHVAKLVREKFDGNGGANIFIGGALMEPYFLIPPLKSDKLKDKKRDGDFRLQTEDLIPATQKALTYYSTIENLFASDTNYQNAGADRYIFDALYPLGLYPLCNNITMSGDLKEEDYHKGNDAQRSLFSLADLLASLALCDFLGKAANGGANPFQPAANTHNLMNTKLKHIGNGATSFEIEPFKWENLPKGEDVKKNLLAMARFSIYITSYLVPDYYDAKSRSNKRDMKNTMLGGQIHGNQLYNSEEDQKTVEAVFTYAKQFLSFLRDVAATNAGNQNSPLAALFDIHSLGRLLKMLGNDMADAAGKRNELRTYAMDQFGSKNGGMVHSSDKRIETDGDIAYDPDSIYEKCRAGRRGYGSAAEYFSYVYQACLALSSHSKEVE